MNKPESNKLEVNEPNAGLESQIKALDELSRKLLNKDTLQEKLKILNEQSSIQSYIRQHSILKPLFDTCTPEEEVAIKSLIAIGQAPFVLNTDIVEETDTTSLHQLLTTLTELELFYQQIGGIIGYHLAVLRLIVGHEKKTHVADPHITYKKPEGIHLTEDSKEVRLAVYQGIESLPQMAEIYPVGGAADRLDLHEDATGMPLPAAMLFFEGRTLLEGLIRDVQAKEYLYYKLFKKQVITPIAMMTSQEKSNQSHIINLCKSHQYFNRPKESYFFFLQPLVPVITKEGNWSMTTPFQLTLKPGGHGVIWKVAQEYGAFEWLAKQERHRVLIRQINNPLAGTDHTLLALAGLGCHGKKAFGFVSCDRLLNSAEGINVLKEKKTDKGFDYCISNIEYTDMKLHGIKEEPLEPESMYSQYPANTNALFADLDAIQHVLKACSIPGQLINMKHKVPFIDSEGHLTYIEGGRLESLMQNIADTIVDHFPHQPHGKELAHLKTFITYNRRSKTLSTTKKLYQEKESPIATPEYAFYDRLSNHHELLMDLCKFKMPSQVSIEEFLKQGPSSIFLFHPALGPLFPVVAQKIRGGSLAAGAEIQLEIAEVDFENLNVEGSLLIRADRVMGAVTSEGVLQNGEETGKCILHNVTIKNKGINRSARQCYWKNEIHRHEALRIHLSGNAEFYAKDVVFTGDYHIEVPSGHRLIAYQNKGRLAFKREKLSTPTWFWSYLVDDEKRIILKKIFS